MTNQSGVWKKATGLSEANAGMGLNDNLIPWLSIPEAQEGRVFWFISVHPEHGKNVAMLLFRLVSHLVAISPAFVCAPVS